VKAIKRGRCHASKERHRARLCLCFESGSLISHRISPRCRRIIRPLVILFCFNEQLLARGELLLVAKVGFATTRGWGWEGVKRPFAQVANRFVDAEKGGREKASRRRGAGFRASNARGSAVDAFQAFSLPPRRTSAEKFRPASGGPPISPTIRVAQLAAISQSGRQFWPENREARTSGTGITKRSRFSVRGVLGHQL